MSIKPSPTRAQLIKAGIIKPSATVAQKPHGNQASIEAAIAARRASFRVAARQAIFHVAPTRK